MRLAIASGKGGTGKTTLAVSLALVAKGPVQFIDCDVEEPNAALFLHPEITERRRVTVEVPKIREELCTYCGACRDICRFNAITVFGKTIMTFPELCHSCGGCFRVCPEGAVIPAEREIGWVEKGNAGRISFTHGILRVGEAMAPPLISAVKETAQSNGLVLFDAPPGTSCPVVATVRDADFVILVTEPTPFGFHDLKLAVGVMRKLELPFGVVINRADLGDDRVRTWCGSEGISVLLEIPFDRRIAEGYSRGDPLIESRPDLRSDFERVLGEVTP